MTHTVERSSIVIDEIASTVGWVEEMSHLDPPVEVGGSDRKLAQIGEACPPPVGDRNRIGPQPFLTRRKANLPCPSPIPKTGDRQLLTIRTREDGIQSDFSRVIGIGISCVDFQCQLDRFVARHLSSICLHRKDRRQINLRSHCKRREDSRLERDMIALASGQE